MDAKGKKMPVRKNPGKLSHTIILKSKLRFWGKRRI